MATRNLAELAEIGFKGYTPVPAGPYKTEITNVTPKVSSNKNPMVIVEYSIADGPYKGKKVKDQMTFAAESEGSLGVFFGKMRNLGLTKEWWDQLPAFEGIIDAVPYVAQALIGRPAYRPPMPGVRISVLRAIATRRPTTAACSAGEGGLLVGALRYRQDPQRT